MFKEVCCTCKVIVVFFDVLFAVRVVGSQTSKDVFKRRRSTGSLELNFCPTFWTNRLYNEKEAKKYKFGTVSLFKMKKISLPVYVRRSKTPLLNLPSDGNFVAP